MAVLLDLMWDIERIVRSSKMFWAVFKILRDSNTPPSVAAQEDNVRVFNVIVRSLSRSVLVEHVEQCVRSLSP